MSEFYDLIRTRISTPDTYYNDLVQADINTRWDDSTQVKNVNEQTLHGGNEYIDIEVRVDTAVDMGTGLKKSDDFKRFAFRDLNHIVEKGRLYKFSSNYWITWDTSEVASVTKDITVRRCTNTLKWLNPINGYIYEEPCVIDYELSSPKPSKDKDVIVENGHYKIVVQGNTATQELKVNQRFIFNGKPFKLSVVNKGINDGAYSDDTSKFLTLDLYYDPIQYDKDNIDLGVADYYNHLYKIIVNKDVAKQLNGFKGQLYATTTLNGGVVVRDIVFKGNDNVSVQQNGSYTLTGVAGDVAEIRAYIKGNEENYEMVMIEIVEFLEDDYKIVISPEYSQVRVTIPVTFDVNLYNNGVKNTTPVIATVGGLDNSFYNLINYDNTFTLSAKKFSKTPLTILFKSGGYTKELQITLKSLI